MERVMCFFSSASKTTILGMRQTGPGCTPWASLNFTKRFAEVEAADLLQFYSILNARLFERLTPDNLIEKQSL